MNARIAWLFVLAAAFVASPASVDARDARDPAARADASAAYPALIERHGAAIVRLRFVVTVEGGGNDLRQEGETTAVLVSPDGLVLVADGVVNLRSAWAAAATPGTELPDPKLSELRVRVVGRDEEYAAELVTRDADLGLAWLALQGAPTDLPYVDLSDARDAAVGDVYYSLTRLSADFGEAVASFHGFVVGETDTPTKALLVNGPTDLAFDASGNVIGFVTRYRTRDWRYAAQFGGTVPQQMIAGRRVARATTQASAIAKRPPPAF